MNNQQRELQIGKATSAILVSLLQSLVAKEILSNAEVRGLLTKAANDLGPHGYTAPYEGGIGVILDDLLPKFPEDGAISARVGPRSEPAFRAPRPTSHQRCLDGLPFLQAAKQVRIFTVIDEGRPPSGTELCDHLARKIDSTFATVRSTIGSVLETYVVEHEIDLLVMGAYGHSRFREFFSEGRPKASFSVRSPGHCYRIDPRWDPMCVRS
jgi:hypothetical protein